MEGPLNKCKIQSKINRWKSQIAAAIADDKAAGVYPAIVGQHPVFDESVWYLFETEIVNQVEAFRSSVACGAGGSAYTPEQWGEMYSSPVGEMLDISAALPQMAGWQGGGSRSFNVVVIIVPVVIVVLALVLLIAKRKAIKQCCASCCEGGGGGSSVTNASMTMTTEALNPGFKGGTTQVRVEVPAGSVAGQSLLVNAPGGGSLVAKIPPKCKAFSLVVPADEPASRSVTVTPKDGKLGISLALNPTTSGAKIAMVAAGSAAADAGVMLGEQVVTINGQPVPLGSAAVTAGTNMLRSSGATCVLQLTKWTPSITVLSDSGIPMA